MRQFRVHYAVNYAIFLAYFQLLYMVKGYNLSSASLQMYFVQQLRINYTLPQMVDNHVACGAK